MDFLRSVDLNKLLLLFGAIGFFSGLAVMLLRLDKSDEWGKAHIAQLVLNRHGEFDIAAVGFWIGLLFSILVITYCLLKGKVPEGLGYLYMTFMATIEFPLLAKIVYNAKTIPQMPTIPGPPDPGPKIPPIPPDPGFQVPNP